MAFVQHKPTRTRSNANVSKKIRASFKVKEKDDNAKTITLTIYIGKIIAKEMGFGKDFKLNFFYDDEDNRKWMLKKPDDGSGYKAVELNKESEDVGCFRIQMTLKIPDFIITDKDLETRDLKHEIKDDKSVIIDAH